MKQGRPEVECEQLKRWVGANLSSCSREESTRPGCLGVNRISAGEGGGCV